MKNSKKSKVHQEKILFDIAESIKPFQNNIKIKTSEFGEEIIK